MDGIRGQTMVEQDIDTCLTPEERRNVAAAYEQLDAAMAGWRDRAEGRQRLDAVLADDFVWFVPTSDPARQARGSKQDYIDYVTVFQHENYQPGSRVEIFAHTAHGNRVATEMLSDIVRKDGSPYRNRYHQLFKFNDKGQVKEYRVYMDSAVIVTDAFAACERAVRAFIAALGSGDARTLKVHVTENFRWLPADGAGGLDVDAVAALVQAAKAKRTLTLEIIPEGLIAEEGVASIEVTSGDGVVHSLVATLQGDRIAGIEEFSGGRSIVDLAA
ncbi:nuclear transport factor 2 family protein [Sphingosinicella xenopeptidilytica]|uniref:Nuclear transport factor 2 family protein n=1 Tax=Sphingosinicella xenopeptidilytica TaxID=364098 RepID=A0ABW3C628_SPHXN